MTEKRAREIEQLAAKAYTDIINTVDAKTNEEYDYFLAIIMQNIAVNLPRFLRDDFTK